MNQKTQPELGFLTKDFALGDGWEVKAVNDQERTFSGMANASTVDRMGERINSKGVDLRQFRKQPMLLINHWPFLPNGAPGRIGDVTKIDATDKGLPISAQVYTDDNAAADLYWPYIAKRRIAGLSIGYIPTDWKWADEVVKGEPVRVREITKSELLEVSVVMIQANREAMIKQALGDAGLSVPDFGGLQDFGELHELAASIHDRQVAMDGRLDTLARRFDDFDQALAELHNAITIGPGAASILSAAASRGGDGGQADDDDALSDDDQAALDDAMGTLSRITGRGQGS